MLGPQRQSNDTYGQLGDQTTTTTATPRLVAKPFIAVAAGSYHACGIAPDHSLWCWGQNAWGQLGTGNLAEAHDPQPVGTDTDWASVYPAQTHTCALKQDGSLWCWGGNTAGQLGDGRAWRSNLVEVE